jgi:hypothetical protein
MPTTKKRSVRKSLKKSKNNTVIVIATELDAKDTLFPEKALVQKK